MSIFVGQGSARLSTVTGGDSGKIARHRWAKLPPTVRAQMAQALNITPDAVVVEEAASGGRAAFSSVIAPRDGRRIFLKAARLPPQPTPEQAAYYDECTREVNVARHLPADAPTPEMLACGKAAHGDDRW